MICRAASVVKNSRRSIPDRLIPSAPSRVVLGVCVRDSGGSLKRCGDKVVVHGFRGLPCERNQRGYRAEGCEDPIAARVSGIRADAGGRVFEEETRHRGEPGNGVAVNDGGQVEAHAETEGGEGA